MNRIKLAILVLIATSLVTSCAPASPTTNPSSQPFLTLPPRYTPTVTPEVTDTATATTVPSPSATSTRQVVPLFQTPTPTITEEVSCPVTETSTCGLVPRGCYRTYDIYNDPWLSGWAETYNEAREQAASWVLDPRQLALRFVGYFSSGQQSHDHVNVHDQITGETMVLICDYGLLSDSVWGIERRIDLVQDGPFWAILWAGARYRCQPNRGSQDWSTVLCN
jgi:hypothetical protein